MFPIPSAHGIVRKLQEISKGQSSQLISLLQAFALFRSSVHPRLDLVFDRSQLLTIHFFMNHEFLWALLSPSLRGSPLRLLSLDGASFSLTALLGHGGR